MRPYLDAANQNERDALALYRWHSELTAAVQAILGTTEVVLRNAIDRELQQWNNLQSDTTQSWLLHEPEAPLRALSAGKRKDALSRARKDAAARLHGHPRFGHVVNHDDVLAQVMFGMWKDLLPNHLPDAQPEKTENRNRLRLWEESLHRAFPLTEDSNGEITFWRVARIHKLRNRVSHMEPLLTVDITDEIDRAFKLLRSIDTDVANWVTGGSKVSEILGRRPGV